MLCVHVCVHVCVLVCVYRCVRAHISTCLPMVRGGVQLLQGSDSLKGSPCKDGGRGRTFLHLFAARPSSHEHNNSSDQQHCQSHHRLISKYDRFFLNFSRVTHTRHARGARKLHLMLHGRVHGMIRNNLLSTSAHQTDTCLMYFPVRGQIFNRVRASTGADFIRHQPLRRPFRPSSTRGSGLHTQTHRVMTGEDEGGGVLQAESFVLDIFNVCAKQE